MAIRTFNIADDIYAQFSAFCKERGISMSRQVQFFMESFVEGEPAARADYLEKLDRIRKGRFIKVKKFSERYGLEK
ncbi:MAG TPA: hypothetical protein VJI13_03560 [Candidatus Norongarragalinales archaeon]|nr:hypothetical protein [Candidatus Norongarragalinales archaeon]